MLNRRTYKVGNQTYIYQGYQNLYSLLSCLNPFFQSYKTRQGRPVVDQKYSARHLRRKKLALKGSKVKRWR
jgi:hypothetical protein